MERDLKIDEKSIRNIAKTDLEFKRIKFKPVHVLADETKQQQLKKGMAFLNRFACGTHHLFLSSDDVTFSIEQEFNKQNDRILSQKVTNTNSQ